jgi:6-pyruvoyltetrahydropterin/6-carboxytetrahydropterin synthase
VLYLKRRYGFSAAHRLFNASFDDAKNWKVFEKCNNPNGHGHNYELELILSGPLDADSGMVVNILDLDQIVEEQLIEHVDHKHLNLDVPFLQGINPTAENLAIAFYERLHPLIPGKAVLVGVRLQESKNNLAEYYGQAPAVPLVLQTS